MIEQLVISQNLVDVFQYQNHEEEKQARVADIRAFAEKHVNYQYPTWADIILKSHSVDSEVYNLGRSGAGNQYVITKIWEAHARHNFCPGDTVYVSWTYFHREDRYHLEGGWYTPGNIYQHLLDAPLKVNNRLYRSDLEWADPLHYVLRDCVLITSTKLALAQLGVTLIDTMVDELGDFMPDTDNILNQTEYNKDPLDENDIPLIVGKFGDYLTTVLPPVIPNCDKTECTWFDQKNNKIAVEEHPITGDYLRFVDFCNIEITQEARQWALDWNDRLLNNQPLTYPIPEWDNAYATKMGWTG